LRAWLDTVNPRVGRHPKLLVRRIDLGNRPCGATNWDTAFDLVRRMPKACLDRGGLNVFSGF